MFLLKKSYVIIRKSYVIIMLNRYIERKKEKEKKKNIEDSKR